jgi:hypothetical protein
VIHNCNFAAREDDRGRLVLQAVQWSESGRLCWEVDDEEAVLDALADLEETLAEGNAERDDAAAATACACAEERVANLLRSCRAWVVDAHAHERLDSPAVVEAMARCDWNGYYPIIDGDLRLTGGWDYADDPGEPWLSYGNEAYISRDDATAAGWTIDDDGIASPPKVEVLHPSPVPHARWCRPIGWAPSNRIDGAEWEATAGAWIGPGGEVAGMVVFTTEHSEGDIAHFTRDAFRVVGGGRVIAEVEIGWQSRARA